MINSKRTFLCTWIEGSDTTNERLNLSDIFKEGKNDWEYLYAIRNNIDIILDLKEGESKPMKFNRDNRDSWGFIKRIK